MIQGAISYVASSLRANDMPNPTKDADRELGQVLSRLFRAFKNRDKPEKQQSTISICVVKEVLHRKAAETDRAIGQLAVTAFFFACCSCKYLKKRDVRQDTMTQLSTGDLILCPVQAWAAVVKHIWRYPGATTNMAVSTVYTTNTLQQITSNMMINVLRDVVVAIREESLGFKKNLLALT
eukprot:3062475-Ditylum_brightwellii.AAC.1